jgi:F-type H+-transporting ATPase subunit b
MPAEQRAAIQNALNETFSAEVRVSFETSTGTLCGIELAANGQKVGWNIADYLGSLGRKVEALIADLPGTGAGSASPPEAKKTGAMEPGVVAAAS